MFYHLLYPLKDYISAFNVFRYITFRTAYATLTSLVICFVLGPVVVRMLRERGIVNGIRADTPERHAGKRGTPTMGGIIIIIAVVIPTLLWADLTNKYILMSVLATCWLGMMGLLDDYFRAVKNKPAGLVGRYKIAGQAILGLAIGSNRVPRGPCDSNKDHGAVLQERSSGSGLILHSFRDPRDHRGVQRRQPCRR